jgi:hypothetical protein
MILSRYHVFVSAINMSHLREMQGHDPTSGDYRTPAAGLWTLFLESFPLLRIGIEGLAEGRHLLPEADVIAFVQSEIDKHLN